MKYLGSKRKHAKELLPIILKNRKENQWYVEPFVGGANVIDKVDGNRIGSDIDEDLICLWKAVSEEEWLPPEHISEEEYKQIKNSKEMTPLRGYVAFTLSFGAKKFGGYSRSKTNRNYSLEAYNSALKQFPLLKGIKFQCCSYLDLKIPDNSIIYCDPPYKNTTKYNKNINHEQFWQWCREKSLEHEVYVSEYNAPEDFMCIWENRL